MQNASQKAPNQAQKTKIPAYIYGIVGLVLIIGLGSGILIGWVITHPAQNNSQGNEINPPALNTDQTPPVVTNIPTTTDGVNDSSGDLQSDEDGFIPEPTTEKATLTVTWLKTPVMLSFDNMLQLTKEHGSLTEEELTDLKEFYQNIDSDYENVEMWERGSVRGGKYDGSKIYLLKTTASGMGTYYKYNYLLSSDDDSKLYILVDNDYFYPNDFEKYLTPARDIKIATEAMPEKFTLTNGKVIYTGSPGGFAADANEYGYEFEFLTNNEYKSIAKTTDGRDVYRVHAAYQSEDAISGCLLVFSKEGKPYYYASQIPGEWVTNDDSEPWVPSAYNLDITWNTEYQNDNLYLPYTSGGCGGHDCTDIVSAEVIGDLDNLVVAGKTKSGEAIYVPKDQVNNQDVIYRYDRWTDYSNQGERGDIETFVAKYIVPIFYWKDGFGNWVRYVESSSQPQGECGKPVIYLYPEEETQVHVQLPDFIGVTVSDPIYPQGGWNVLAHPNGQLDYSDGNSYGSLFWEGVGVNYQTPATGFVVKNDEVESFLDKTLTEYGLNTTEKTEFMDFWVPLMSDSPYYRISFLVEDWNQAAPLYVSPRPDTYIRIFMDWEKLDSPIEIQAPQINPPERKGFTLVEWGGSLKK